MLIMTLLPNLDLNLIKLFVDLYQTGSVRETAENLNLSQSACSHALQRLRDRLADDLFVRVGNRMLATEYSHEIAADLMTGLQHIAIGLSNSLSFEPSEPNTFRIATTDYTSKCLTPLLPHFATNYPDLRLEFIQLNERFPEEILQKEKLDIICGFSHQPENYEYLNSQPLFTDSYVCIRCETHPLKGSLNLDEFLRFGHIVVTPWNEGRGIVDFALASLKKKRKIAIKTSSVIVAPDYICNTPYLLTLPRRYANELQKRLPIQLSELPVPVPDYQIKLYWHKTRQNDPKIRWFCEQAEKVISGRLK